MTKPFESLYSRLEKMKAKKRLKAAFRRIPKPAKVRIPDEIVPHVNVKKDKE
jgi:3'-phosphoadenosine 5'-phosphosulfate sulfotransferase